MVGRCKNATFDISFIFRCLHGNIGSVTQHCMSSHKLCIQKTLAMQTECPSEQNGKDNHHLYASKVMLELKYVPWK